MKKYFTYSSFFNLYFLLILVSENALADSCRLVFQRTEHPDLYSSLGDGPEKITLVAGFASESGIETQSLIRTYLKASSLGVEIVPGLGEQRDLRLVGWRRDGMLVTMGFHGSRAQLNELVANLEYIDAIYEYRLFSSRQEHKVDSSFQPFDWDRVIGAAVNSDAGFSNMPNALREQLGHFGAILINKRLQGGQSEINLLNRLAENLAANQEHRLIANRFMYFHLPGVYANSLGTFFKADLRENYRAFVGAWKSFRINELPFYGSSSTVNGQSSVPKPKVVGRVFLSSNSKLVTSFVDRMNANQMQGFSSKIHFHKATAEEWSAISYDQSRALNQLFKLVSRYFGRDNKDDESPRTVVVQNAEADFRVDFAILKGKIVILQMITVEDFRTDPTKRDLLQKRFDDAKAALGS